MNEHMQEHKREMDHLEKNALRETIVNYSLQGNHLIGIRESLQLLKY